MFTITSSITGQALRGQGQKLVEFIYAHEGKVSIIYHTQDSVGAKDIPLTISEWSFMHSRM